MLKKILHWLGYIEIVLFFIAIILFVSTAHANDFSVFVVLYPIYAMFGVGIVALITYVAMLGTGKGSASQPPKSAFKRLFPLIAVSVPLLYVIDNFTGGYGNGLTIFTIEYIVVLAVFIVLNKRHLILDITLYALLIIIPILFIAYAAKMNDANIYLLAKIIGGVLLVVTVISVVIRIRQSQSSHKNTAS